MHLDRWQRLNNVVLRLKRKPWQHGHVRSSPHTSLGWSSWLKPITSHWYRYWGQSNLTTLPQESYGSGYGWQDSTTISTMYQETFLHCWYTFTCTLIIRQQWHKTPGWSRDDNGTLSHVANQHTNTFWLPENPRRGQNEHLSASTAKKDGQRGKTRLRLNLCPTRMLAANSQ